MFALFGLLSTFAALGRANGDVAQRTRPEIEVVARRIKAALAQLSPAANMHIDSANDSLVVEYLPQTFKVHSTSMTAEISPTAHDEEGPSYRGFVLNVTLQRRGEVNQAVRPQTLRRPYWSTDLDVVPLGKSDKRVYWALSYGSRTDRTTLKQLRITLDSLAER